MSDNPLLKLHKFGQSVWLDYISRDMLGAGGALQKLIDNDGLRGVTSNPAIFEEAIDTGSIYNDAIRTLAKQGKTTPQIYDALTVEDVGRGADLFRPLYDRENGGDGYVSLEVSPHLARDTQGTIAEARRLWAALNRPNVFIKVPGTKEGLPAIETLISEGINVNVTLLFGVPRYEEVVGAYMGGLEKRAAAGKPLDRVASVASFFISRIDSLVDELLDGVVKAGGAGAATAAALHGKIAIANAKVAYQLYKDLYASSRWEKLSAKGAKRQRLLWASTSTKNPKYPDVIYVEDLIGPDTVNTIPLKTLEAYRDHGKPAARLELGLTEAQRQLQQLAAVGVDINQVTLQLEDEGVKKFVTPFDKLLGAIDAKRKTA